MMTRGKGGGVSILPKSDALIYEKTLIVHHYKEYQRQGVLNLKAILVQGNRSIHIDNKYKRLLILYCTMNSKDGWLIYRLCDCVKSVSANVGLAGQYGSLVA